MCICWVWYIQLLSAPKWIIYNCRTDSSFGIAALCFPQTVSCCTCVVSVPCLTLLIPYTRWTLTCSYFLVKNDVYFFTSYGFFFFSFYKFFGSLPWLWRLVAALTAKALVHSQPRPYGICGREWVTRTGFSPISSVFAIQYNSVNVPYSFTHFSNTK
jgi:hypothetical protein